MSQQQSMLLTGSSWRLAKDKAARYGVTLGGAMVLIALLLIFFYLLYVVQPIFRSVHVEEMSKFSLPERGQTLAVGVEEQNEIGFRMLDSGNVEFFAVQDKNGVTAGEVINNVALPVENVASFAASAPMENSYAYANARGEVVLVKPAFRVTFPDNQRLITPYVTYPLGEAPLAVDEQYRTLTKIAFEAGEERYTFAGVTESGELVAAAMVGEEDFITEEVVWAAQSISLPDAPSGVTMLNITPDHQLLFAAKENLLWVYDIRDADEAELVEVVTVNSDGSRITSVDILAGASSLMVGTSDGEVSQWFQIPGESGKTFSRIRSFQNGDEPIIGLYSEYFRRSFMAQSQGGELNLYFTTSDAHLWTGKVLDGEVEHFAFSPRSNSALVSAGNTFTLIEIDNEHPEVTWSALWQEVWYEGYPEPSYIWQSTSGSDDFEGKFSLVPISFGTLKAAAYAMLFAVPIGLSAAIYTAYFMSPGLRKYVKPTIEIMEALPTVILGFLAGLWLAPLIEESLPGVVILLLTLPVSILLTAFAWHNLPKRIKQMIPNGWDSVVLMPVVLLVGYFAFASSEWVEAMWFGGDMRQYITNDLGIDFDQRNSMVVGIAMGFAVIPTIFSIAEDAVFSVPKHLSNGSLALGATQWQTLIGVVLLTASPGIFSAVMMGLGRAVGETMIVLMATGNTPIMDWSIFQGMRTLAANIAVEMPESEVGSSHYRILFLAAFVLFIFTFIFNTLAEFVRQRLRERYSSL